MANFLPINTQAPIFKANDVHDNMVDLKKYIGQRTFIAFFRHTGCPFCNIRIHQLIKAYRQGDFKDLRLVFFFQSKKNLILQSSFLSTLPEARLISDTTRKWYGIYGVQESFFLSMWSHVTSLISSSWKAKKKNLPVYAMKSGESLNTMPAEFLIDEALIIRHAHYSKSLTHHLPIETIKEFSKAINPKLV